MSDAGQGVQLNTSRELSVAFSRWAISTLFRRCLITNRFAGTFGEIEERRDGGFGMLYQTYAGPENNDSG